MKGIITRKSRATQSDACRPNGSKLKESEMAVKYATFSESPRRNIPADSRSCDKL